MKKTEFLNKLREELEKRNIADAADILEEYEQHFDLKLADCFFEEEIAARLGDPTMLAAQFDETERTPQKESAACASLISLALFAAYFVLSYVVCALSAGSLQFWHVWGWFAN